MGWSKNYKGYLISYYAGIYEVFDKDFKLLFTSKTIKPCKEYIKKLFEEVLGNER